MSRSVRVESFAILWLMLLPSAAFAQASITGVVRDTSGAVLPGVTVETASSALIEKLRSVVTDGSGQYRIVDLPPGQYAVTFTLGGFSTARREGVELTGAFTATVNAELRVGTLEETVTVTGETSTVDVQSMTRQRVVDREVFDTLPAGRTIQNLAALAPGITSTNVNVGGTTVNSNAALSVHGSRSSDQQWLQSGMRVTSSAGSGHTSRLSINLATVQEVTIDYSGGDATVGGGGVRINFIPREGTNRFNGTSYVSSGNSAMQADNLTQELQDRGLRTPDSLARIWDFNAGFGGPMRRDRLWFFVSPRFHGAKNGVAGMFHDLNAGNPNAWTYEPDLGRPAFNTADFRAGDLRLTWQATEKHKFASSLSYQSMYIDSESASATLAPEAWGRSRWPAHQRSLGEWTYPATNRFLLEAGLVYYNGPSFRDAAPGVLARMIPVMEQSTGLTYRASPNTEATGIRAWHKKLIGSYVTGAHAFKFGTDHSHGYRAPRSGNNNQPLSFRFNNGIPNLITLQARPFESWVDELWVGMFAQDRWTLDRLTLNYGVRYDHFGTSFPEQRLGPTVLTPTRDVRFPAQESIAWHDITPKLGAAYDLSGNGRTALKVSLNKYVANYGGNNAIVNDPNPINSVVNQTTRSWNDANGDFVPNCDLINPLAVGECGAMDNANFGLPIPGAVHDPGMMRGWGKREYNWEFSTGVQHELLSRVTMDVGYFRRWYGNFRITDDRAVSASDFDRFSITAPAHPGLPGGGGYAVDGLFNLNPAKFGVPANNFVTSASHYGKQTENWQGLDLSLSARPRPGIMLQGGFSTGRTATNNCEILAQLPERGPLAAPYCDVNTGYLTQVKFFGSYTVPRIDVLLSGSFQSLPGPQVAANFVVPTAAVVPSLGRNLSGGARNVTVNLVAPGEIYGDRLNQVDLRVGKVLRFGRTRSTISVDLYNALNGSTVLTENSSFAVWRQPTSILMARFAQVTVQLEF